MRLAALNFAIAQILPGAPPSVVQANAGLVLTVYSGLRVMARSGVDIKTLKASRQALMAALRFDPY